MHLRTLLHSFFTIALMAALVASCVRREESDTTMTSDTMSFPGGTTATGGAAAAEGSLRNLSDGNILALVHVVDSLEIAMANLAQAKAVQPAVKDFAATMLTEHTRMQREAQEIARRQNLEPLRPAGTLLRAEIESAVRSLESAQGPAFDSLYMASQVLAHERILRHLSEIVPQDTALRAMLDRARPHFEYHLTEARKVQSGLATATSLPQGR